MKKSIFSITMFTLSFLGVHNVNAQEEQAQKPKYQFEAGVGVWSTGNIVYALSDMMVNGVTNINMRNSSASGTFHAGFKYLFTDRLSAGATVSFGQEKTDGYNDNTFFGTLKRSNVSLAAEADFKYLRSGKFSVYGLAGIGGIWLHQQFNDETDNKINLDFQLTPIGVKFGDKFGGFAELGLGYKGILNAGLFIKM